MKYKVIDSYAYIEVSSIIYKTIQEFLDALIPSKKYQHLCIQNKWMTLDGKSVQRNTLLQGDILKINLYPETYSYTIKSNQEVEVLYEDELFLIVNKPSGILVHSDGSDKITMCDLVESMFVKEGKQGSVHPIHRLDEFTQGVLVFSKSILFQALLDSLLSEKKIARYYLAFVEGKISKVRTICEPIGKDRHNAKKRRVSKQGQYAKTQITPLYTQKEYSVVKCRLETGRTHQIRVHLAHIKHPILNDMLYGRQSKKCTHMGLVASEIKIYHPLKEKEMIIKGKMSKDLENLYQ